MTTHSSILTWKISWTEEPGRLQCMGSRRVTTECTNTHTQANKNTCLKERKQSIIVNVEKYVTDGQVSGYFYRKEDSVHFILCWPDTQNILVVNFIIKRENDLYHS
ncbi:hypothetical protein MG293_001731 [Ovis ammon polii]|uniref:Uncharacterized protein n=1 Tax=Ovis ammon polii TaxID=230172 RepID=A0AAD4YJC2_OVIAM|nr:hypothetical protein MG293_001731 [Ovis ammon polii]